MENNNENRNENINYENKEEVNNGNNESGFVIERLNFFEYRPPVSIEQIPNSKMSELEKNIEKHLDYNESCRARGRVRAGEHRTMGPYPFSR